MRQASVKLIESLPHTGGELTALYPEKYIYEVAGFPNIRADELGNKLEQTLNIIDSTIALGQSIKKVEKLDDGTFKLVSQINDVHYTKVVIITAGYGAFEQRQLTVDGCEQFEGNNLHYFVKDV